MDDLKVPLAHARCGVEAHDRVGKQVVAQAVAAVEVVARRRHGQVDEPALVIDRERRPDIGVAGDLPRLVRPTCR